MGLEGRILVIGSGKSGISSANLLLRNHAQIAIYDGNDTLTPDDIRARSDLFGDIEVYIKDMTDEEIASFDHVVVSPGVSMESPLLVRCRSLGRHIIGEIELAYLYAKGAIVGITGTNGKTTTTTLVGEIMKRKYKDVYVVGNIGMPYTDIADQTTQDSVTVIELSSFQLETVEAFHANVSAVLNLTPDHLDRHHTMENYAACKMRVTNLGTKSDVCVLNADNEYTAAFAQNCPAVPVLFSSTQVLQDGYDLIDGKICQASGGKQEELMDVHEMNLVGTCNAENVMAAIAMGRGMDVEMDLIIDTIKNFRAVEHRIEYVTTKRGVRFYNDSKGTNPDAAIQGIRAMEGATCLIGGGYDKGIAFDEWIQAFDGKVKKLVLLGQTAQMIAQTARKYGFEDIVFADTLEEAIDLCYAEAKEGENVLLSPACASWGMFPNYEVRGNLFKEYVRGLKE